MKSVKHSFEKNICFIRLSCILPTHVLSQEMRTSTKFRSILASIKEIGVVEPLAIHPAEVGVTDIDSKYILLDGHLRLEALRQLGASEALCLISTDDEGFTYNRQINRLTAIQEHKMIMEAIGKGVTPERIAKSLNLNVGRIRDRQNLLKGITPEVISILKTQVVGRDVFGVLRKMAPMRQIETAEMMTSANCFTLRYAKMMLSMTPQEQLIEKKYKPTSEASAQDIARMEKEMEKLYQNYHSVEDTLGETMLVLVVAKGYVSRLLRNDKVCSYIAHLQPELADELEGVVEAITTDARSLKRE